MLVSGRVWGLHWRWRHLFQAAQELFDLFNLLNSNEAMTSTMPQRRDRWCPSQHRVPVLLMQQKSILWKKHRTGDKGENIWKNSSNMRTGEFALVTWMKLQFLSNILYAKIPSIVYCRGRQTTSRDFHSDVHWDTPIRIGFCLSLSLSFSLFVYTALNRRQLDFDMSCGWYFSIRRSWEWQLSFLKSSRPLLRKKKIFWRAKLISMLSGNEK